MFLLRFIGRIYIFIFYGRFYKWVIKNISLFRPIYETSFNQSPITFKQWIKYKIFGENSGPYWPVHHTSKIVGSWKNIYVGIDASPGISPCCYIQAVGKIFIDDHSQIAPQVGIISSNHFLLDVRKHVLNEVRIGKYCTIGMGSIILPGVILGDFTIVAAGSVVADSFPNGFCVIGGNPAVKVKDYYNDESIKEKFVRYTSDFEYNGFIPHSQFNKFRNRVLNF